MKFQITMKDPDGVFNSILDAAQQSALMVGPVSKDEREDLIESRREDIEEQIKKWFKYGEYLTVEIDTEANTATVCDARNL